MINNTLIGDFKRPKSATYRLVEGGDRSAIFSAGPYQKGVASTIGNSLRRILLSSLSGYAIIGVKFDKITNEFDNVEGVYEDTAIICVNLKKINLGLKDENIKNKVLNFSIKGERRFTAEDITRADPSITVSDPEQVIFNANEKADFTFTLQISYGRGYIPSESFIDNIEAKGTIALDADFSPIRRCGFVVTPMKIGNRADFEKLDLNIETKGVISCEKALRDAAQILKESFLTFNDIEQDQLTTPIDNQESTSKSDKDLIFHETIHDLPLLVKSHYFLKTNNIHEIGQLVTRSEMYLRSKKNFDEEILNDINQSLEMKSLKLNMKGINYLEGN